MPEDHEIFASCYPEDVYVFDKINCTSSQINDKLSHNNLLRNKTSFRYKKQTKLKKANLNKHKGIYKTATIINEVHRGI